MFGILNDARKINGTSTATIQITENSFRSTAIICVSLFRHKTKKKERMKFAINVRWEKRKWFFYIDVCIVVRSKYSNFVDLFSPLFNDKDQHRKICYSSMCLFKFLKNFCRKNLRSSDITEIFKYERCDKISLSCIFTL